VIDLSGMAEAVNSALAEGTPCVVATASKDGVPDLAFKGSLMVYDDDHLAFWERGGSQTLAHLRENPRVAALYRNRERNEMWRFYGVAELHEGDTLRQQIMARVVQPELDRDPERKGLGVLIRVDRVVGRGMKQER
jgi:hypothetical protein